MYRLHRLAQEHIELFELFVPSRFRPSFRQSVEKNTALAVGASGFLQPVGLIWADLAAPGRAVITYMYVLPNFRPLGVEEELLAALEELLVERGCPLVETIFPQHGSTAAWERMLLRHGWEYRERQMHAYVVSLDQYLRLPWVHRHVLAPPFTTCLWTEVTEEEKDVIRAGEGVWYEPRFTPFRMEEQIDGHLSMALRYKERLVGWCIIRRLPEQMVVCDSLYTRREFQGRGRAIPLLTETIKRLAGCGFRYGMFYVNADNWPMLRFVERRMKGCIIRECATKEMYKMLRRDEPFVQT